jgi:hypothetical protein
MTIRKLQEYIKYFTNYYQRKSAYTSIDSTPMKISLMVPTQLLHGTKLWRN